MNKVDFPVEVPDGQHGEAKISTFSVDLDSASWSNLRLMRDGEYWMRDYLNRRSNRYW